MEFNRNNILSKNKFLFLPFNIFPQLYRSIILGSNILRNFPPPWTLKKNLYLKYSNLRIRDLFESNLRSQLEDSRTCFKLQLYIDTVWIVIQRNHIIWGVQSTKWIINSFAVFSLKIYWILGNITQISFRAKSIVRF